LSDVTHDSCDLSVVISTRNRSRRLRLAIASVLNQTAPGLRFEVIVVDNNSTDDTEAAIRSFEGGETPVRYVFEEHLGVSNGRNAGILAARAPIVAITDDDVLVDSDWVATIVRLFRGRPDIDCIGGRVLPLWEGPKPPWLDRRHWSPLSLIDYGDAVPEIGSEYPLCLITSNMAMRRSAFDRVGFFSPAFRRCQDHEWQVRYWRAGGRALYSPHLVAYAAVPVERLEKRYHRAWYREQSGFCALMQISESISADGSLSPVPIGSESTRVFGSPAYLYRELLEEMVSWVKSAVRLRRAESFASANRVRYLKGYLRKRWELSRAGNRRRRAAGLWPRLTGHAGGPGSMTRSRRWIVHGLLAFVIGGHLIDIARDTEHWPFSQYPMFSDVDESPTYRTLRLYGIEDGREIPLLSMQYLHPFDQCRVSTALSRMARRGSAQREFHEALADVWARYDARRKSGLENAPRLSGVRLYELEWRLEPDAANAERPEHRRLLADYLPPSTGE
jgi:glucosyl-dolichyl phosphate glucuronosyltransferase